MLSLEHLKAMLVGKYLAQIPMPAAVLDRAVVKRNCDQMLDACRNLGVKFRPHIKTHKTIEITQLQVGSDSKEVNIIVSTIAEAEHVASFLTDCRKNGKLINILYGMPLPPSQAQRLAQLGKELGPGSISVLIDHIDQLQALRDFANVAGFETGIFIKVDGGYGRAGLPPHSDAMKALIKAVLVGEKHAGGGQLRGFYSHAGHSYGVDSPAAAMKHLSDELESLISAVSLTNEIAEMNAGDSLKPKYILSVGATPSATSVQNLYRGNLHSREAELEVLRLKDCIERGNKAHVVELHAGVYPILDMQQLATRASPTANPALLIGETENISVLDIALTILVEVTSFYENREPSEALIAAGSLALGREPCKSYKGWGVVSNWGFESMSTLAQSCWEVTRISQEHGILQRASRPVPDDSSKLAIGQQIRIWPNHACVAGAGFGYYHVVDSSLPEKHRDVVVDVWVRCRGW